MEDNMSKLLIDIKEKTKAEIVKKAKKMGLTLKAMVLLALGIDD